MFDGIKNFFNSKFVPSEKDYEAKGMLSPEQFMQAGDQLTNFGWKWQKALSKPSKMLPNLEKQYLVAPATSMTRIRKLTEQQILESKGNEWGFVEISG
jgi:ubiquitin-like-conjugating enzyme ATG3